MPQGSENPKKRKPDKQKAKQATRKQKTQQQDDAHAVAGALSAAHSLQQSRDKVVTSTLLFDVVSAPDQQQPL